MEHWKNFVHTVEIKSNQNGLVTFYKIFLLCSTEESNLQWHEGEEMMTEFISCNVGRRGLMVRELDSKPKGCEFESRAGRNCRWGEWMSSALSTLNTTTEVPLSKAPNPQLLPGRRSINGCPLLRVCVHCCVCALWMGYVQSTNSEYGSPYLAVCHVTFTFQQSSSKSMLYCQVFLYVTKMHY